MKSLAERFWTKVDKTNEDGCWVWTGSKDRYGYGRIGMKKNGKWTGYNRATRVIWELTYGPIPNGLLLCHHCDNPPCVRIDHLYLGTKSTNARDAIASGLWNARTGNRHPKAKLSVAKAVEIRNLSQAGSSQRELAKKFGVSRRTIRACLSRITWKEV